MHILIISLVCPSVKTFQEPRVPGLLIIFSSASLYQEKLLTQYILLNSNY